MLVDANLQLVLGFFTSCEEKHPRKARWSRNLGSNYINIGGGDREVGDGSRGRWGCRNPNIQETLTSKENN